MEPLHVIAWAGPVVWPQMEAARANIAASWTWVQRMTTHSCETQLPGNPLASFEHFPGLLLRGFHGKLSFIIAVEIDEKAEESY